MGCVYCAVRTAYLYVIHTFVSWLVAGLSPPRPGFNPRSVYAKFLAEKVYLEQAFLRALLFPLSVSFHQCSMPIHSPTTHATCFPPSTAVFPVSTIPPMLHAHSFTYHPRYMFPSQHCCFPCQYHSTNAPCPFIHLPPTLHVSLPALLFSLSVSFHQCSILFFISYHKAKREKPGSPPKSTAVSNKTEHWTAKYFQLVFRELKENDNSRFALEHSLYVYTL